MRRQHVTEPRERRRDGSWRDTARTGSRPAGGGATRDPAPRVAVREVVHDPRAQGKATRGPDETATRRHLEGAEQGPM